MELVRWDQVEGVNRIQSRINELFEDTFGRTPLASEGRVFTFDIPPFGQTETSRSGWVE